MGHYNVKKLDLDEDSQDELDITSVEPIIEPKEEQIEVKEPIEVEKPAEVVVEKPTSTEEIVLEKKLERKMTIPFDEVFIAVKYGRRGRPHCRQVWITKDAICWKVKKNSSWILNLKGIKEKSPRSIPLKEVTEVQKGSETRVFSRHKNIQEKEDLLLSLITKKRTLDLEFVQSKDRDRWFSILQSLMSL